MSQLQATLPIENEDLNPASLASDKKARLSWKWISFLSLAFLAGVALRLSFVQDMEYKEDEQIDFLASQLKGGKDAWPWFGMPSGVYLVNPGMSLWVFTILARLFGIHHPTDLAHAVQAVALMGMSLLVPFALIWVAEQERKLWLWSFALALVNPFLVLYHRKLWPEGFLPLFSVLILMGWWRKRSFFWAFLWGLSGACIGQIHMSGFFLSAACVLTTLIWDRKHTAWKGWFLGSTLGALPLIPWLIHIVQHPVGHSMSVGWEEIQQLKFWVFWITDALGLHLGTSLGVHRGPHHFDQLADFIRFPIVWGRPSYLVGVAHGVLAASGLGVLIELGKNRFTQLRLSRPTKLVVTSAFLGCGILLTLTGVAIRRYYLTSTFPLEFLSLVAAANPNTRRGNFILGAIWVCELIISINFVYYIHTHQGAPLGDYGQAYHLIESSEKNAHPELF
ncbi:MAG: hypothetical protein ACO3A2_06340 [Bdellovibrionia bacterium]